MTTEKKEETDLERMIREASERFAAMPAIERAIHDLEQRRSGARGLAKMSTPREEIDTALDAQPEYVILKAYRLARARIEELEAALRPFAYYFNLNDCATLQDDEALEVPIGDLRRASAVKDGKQ